MYREHYDFLMSSGLYDALVEDCLLVPHEEIASGSKGALNVHKVLRPEFIPFISYPYEWCFQQLKDGALATLQIQKTALDFGMTLKDASAFNIQFLRGRPVLIDLLSFERYQVGKPWIAYRQFCQHFLAPLALMAYKHNDLGKLSRNHIDGIPLDLASSLLPLRTRWRPSLQMHVHLHAKFQKKYSDRAGSKANRKGSFGINSFRGMVDSLESAVRKLKWNAGETEWANYENEDSYDEQGLTHKSELVTAFLKEVKPKTVWDFGANTGRFSRLASDMDIHTVSFDKDPSAVVENYLTSVNRKETHILPLLMDLTNPSPMIGWANQERMDLFERGPADMLLALALIHHLAISENIPLGMIAEFFSRLCRWAVVEFVPKSDKQTSRLLATREDIFPEFVQEVFEREFSKYFEIRTAERITNSQRTLYLMRRR